MKSIKICIFILLLVSYVNSYSQASLNKVKSIESNYQKCLDEGTDMLGCSKKYYFFCDKLLNEVYQSIRAKLDQKNKDLLKKEQLKWIKNRDVYFEKSYFVAKTEADGLTNEDLEMIWLDKKADYVKNRVVHLIKKYKV